MKTDDNNDDMAVGVSRAHAMSTSLLANHEIFCFERSQNIANYTISLAIRNDVELVVRINTIIQNILNGGLNVKWPREHSITISLKENTHTNIWKPIRMEFFAALFHFLYFPGIFLATAAFYAELHIAKRRSVSNCSTKCTILSEFSDGHRHGNILRPRKHR